MSSPIVEEEVDNDDGIDQICYSGEILKTEKKKCGLWGWGYCQSGK